MEIIQLDYSSLTFHGCLMPLFALFKIFFRTPEKLHSWIKTVVDAYHFSREGTLIREARDLMNPKIIEKMEVIMKIVKDKFM